METIFETVKNIRAKCPTLKCRDLKACADGYIGKY